METYLFYAYLKYMQDSKLTFWPRLLKLPKSIVAFTIGAISCALVAVILIWTKLNWLSTFFILGEFAFCIALNFFAERYRIKFSKDNFNEYKQYCIELRDWLKDFDINSEQDIQMIRDRIDKRITVIKDEQKRKSEQSFNWLQALIIPTIVAVATTVISNQKNVANILVYGAVVLLVLAILYGGGVAIKTVMFFPKRRRLEQMECFASDLQGVLDCRKYVEKIEE